MGPCVDPMHSSNEMRRLREELSEFHHLKDHAYASPAGHRLTITGVEDVDSLLEELIAADPDSVAVCDERLPYWASYWACGVAMADWILSGDDIQPGSQVLELGCGLGIGSVAASLRGAQVTATDYQPDALDFTLYNCLQNTGTEPAVELLDWRSPPAGRSYDTVIGSDLAYEKRMFTPLLRCFDALLAPGGRIVFSEGNREVGRPFFGMLEERGWRYELLLEKKAANVYGVTRDG